MRKFFSWVLIVGFLAIDWLLFHDYFKPGEIIPFVDYLVALMSIVVIAASVRFLLKKSA